MIKLNKKGKVVVFTFISTLIITGGLVFNSVLSKEAKQDIQYKEYVVAQGETIWSIANQFKDDKRDIRELIHYIEKDNNLSKKIIYPNQILKIRIRIN